MVKNKRPIGIFDSGYGGLTVFKEIRKLIPDYDFIYLGDNARAPYGNRSFETVYEYTLECVKWFFDQGCPLVILACNTASAKALRTIQQKDLLFNFPEKRVLGVIRPTAEIIGQMTQTNAIGILGTMGTVNSESYKIEIANFFPEVKVFQQACPAWVSYIENGQYNGNEMDRIIQEDLEQLFSQSNNIDTILLACTHYPLVEDKIRSFIPRGIKLISQGGIVADSLSGYLRRHDSLNNNLTKYGSVQFYTTNGVEDFEQHGERFFGEKISAKTLHL